MEKRTLYLVVAIVLVLGVFFVYNNTISDITGRLGSQYRTCIDSDNTATSPLKTDPSRFVKGNIIYTVYDREIKYFDYCYAEMKTGAHMRLAEFYCDMYGRIRTKRFICDYGCVDGTCVKEEVTICTDSDDGLNYEVKGIACVEGQCKDDLCLDKIYLSEAYCKNGTANSKIYSCPNGCQDGACE